ncbi:MAG: hypothetical protein AAF909_05405 [Pseudomonadota bacterium]
MTQRDQERRTYKTVAMPEALKGGRRLGRTRAERAAAAMAEIINAEAEAGWTYLGSDTVRMSERAGLFGGMREAVYTVLVFERETAPESRRLEHREPARREEPGMSGGARQRRDPGEDRPSARRQAADAARVRERGARRGYGFDDHLAAPADEPRPLRRREARIAARRSEGWDGASEGEAAPARNGRRSLVETMRQHRDRT